MIVSKVPFALVDDFIKALGAEPAEVETILVDADGITLTTYRKDAEGHLFAAGRHPAKAITTIGFETRPGGRAAGNSGQHTVLPEPAKGQSGEESGWTDLRPPQSQRAS